MGLRNSNGNGSGALEEDPGVVRLIAKLCGYEEWRNQPLGTLMPGLEAARPPLQEGWLSTRAVNGLGRAGVSSWPDLAAMSPGSLSVLPNIGPKSLREILAVAVGEWARVADGGRSSPADLAVGSHDTDELIGAFEELERSLLDFEIFKRHRLIEKGRPTLQELGDEMGVSRERVRQRECHMREAIAGRMGAEDWPIRIAADRLGERIGGLERLERLPDVLATLDPDGRVFAEEPHRQALLLYLCDYRLAGAWVQSADLDTRTDALLSALTEDGPVDLEDALGELDALGVREGLRLAWIGSRPDFRVLGATIAHRADRLEVAVAVLRDAGRPLALSELLARAASSVSVATFRAQIHHDERFLRRGVRHYGLSEWGGERFTTIAEEIEKEIERGGGAAGLASLTESLVNRFGVAAASVRQTAQTPQFAVDSASRVSRRVGGFVVPRAQLALTRRCFHLESGWALKLVVTPRLLQGANNRMPLAFARALGLQVGTSSTYASRFGDIGASWPRYAATAGRLGSLRIPARELLAKEGDCLFVILVGKGELDFRLVGKSRCEAASDLARLASECGREPTNEPLPQILTALGFDPHLANAEAEIRARLNERQEGELAQALSSWGC